MAQASAMHTILCVACPPEPADSPLRVVETSSACRSVQAFTLCQCHATSWLSLTNRCKAVLQAAERSARQALPTHWGAPKALAQASLRDPNSGSLLPACESTQDLIVRGAYTSWSCCKELEASNSSMPFDAVHRCPALQQATMQDKRQPDL